MDKQPLYKTNAFKFFILTLLIIACIIVGKDYTIQDIEVSANNFKNYLLQYPIGLSGIVFIFLYVVITFFVWYGPKDVFRISAAFIYGAVGSTVLVFIAEMFNAAILFSLTRKLGRGFLENKIGGKIKNIDERIADTSFWSIFLLRLLLIFPLRFMDLGFGLTKISLRKYLLICAIATPPRIFLVQFIFTLGMETVKDPQKLGMYLVDHPKAFFGVIIYMIAAIAAIFVLKKEATTKR